MTATDRTSGLWRRLLAFALFAFVLLTALAIASSSKAAVESPPPPQVWSDKADYAPGEQVTLAGANWAPGEAVHIRVNDDAGETWRRDVDVTAAEDGTISDQFNLPDWFVAQYTVTATGASSGTATWSFTDGNVSLHLATAQALGVTNITVAYQIFGSSGGGGTVDNNCTGPTPSSSGTVVLNAGGSVNIPGFGNNNLSVRLGTVTSTPTGKTIDFWADGDKNGEASPQVSLGASPCISADKNAGTNGNVGDLWAHLKNTNSAPVCTNGSASTPEDTAVPANLSCTDADGNTLSYSIVTGSTNGVLSGTGSSRTYTPNANFNGTDSFTCKANDGTVDSNTATFTITVTEVNDAPTAVADSKSVAEDGTLTFPGSDLTANDSRGPANESGQTLTVSAVSATGSTHGTVSLSAGTVTYTPAANFNGAASFAYTVQDNGTTNGASDPKTATGTVNVTVTAVNDAPVANAQAVTTNEDTAKPITLSGTDVDGDALSFKVTSLPASGKLYAGTVATGHLILATELPYGLGAGNSLVTYDPNANFNGSDSFNLKANDGSVDSGAAAVSITVTAVNDAPVANAQSVTTAEDTAKTVTLSGSDLDGDALDFKITSLPAHGKLYEGTDTSGHLIGPGDLPFLVSAADKVTYDPNLNYNGGDAFNFKAYDGALDSAAAAAVSITVTAVNDDPTVARDSGSVEVNEGQTAANTGTFGDVDGDTVSLSTSVGTLVKEDGAGTWSWSYGTTDGAAQSQTVTITATDGHGGSATTTFGLTVKNVAPTATFNAPTSVNEGSNINISLTGPSDPSTVDTAAGFTYAFDCGSGYGAFSASNGTSCPTTNDGSRTVKGKIRDKDGGSTEYTATVTINNVAPSVTAAAAQSSNEGSSNSFSLGSFTDPGPDGPWSVDVDWGDGSAHTTFTKSSPGSLGSPDHTYADGPNDYTVTVMVTEAGTGTPPSGQATFAVHVNNVAPTVTFANDNDTTVNEGTTHTYSFTVTDPGADDFSVLSFDCGTYGTADEDSLATDASGGSFDCTFPDGPANRNVHVKVEDSDHASDTDSEAIQVVHVVNVAPSVTPAAGQSSNEGENHSFALGSFTDPGPDADWSVDVDWGDGSTHSTFTASDVGSLGSQSHTYANGPNDYTVTVTVTDHEADPADELSGSASFAVHVNNVAPSVTAAAAQSSNEGSSNSFSLGSFTDPGPDGPWSVDVDWGDGSAHTTFTKSSPGSLGSQDHTYADGPNDYTVTVMVTEAGTGTPPSGQATFAVHVNNVAPSGTLGNNGPISEGGSATISFSGVSDPSAADNSTLHYTFSCTGDSLASETYASSSASSSTSCSFSDGPSTPTVTGVIIDKDGGRHGAMTTVTVNNLKPIVTAPADQNATEGSSATLSLGSFSDPGPDSPWTGSVNWGDGSSNTAIGPFSVGGSLGSASHTFANSGTYTVKVGVTDKDGGTGYATFKVTVGNVAPNVTAAANQSGDEGTEKSFDLGSFSDPGTEASWSVDVNWGDGTAHTTFTKSSAGTLGSRPHTYADNGSYTVTVKVSDDTDQGSASFTITIGNVAPVPTWTSYSNILYGPMVFGLTGTWSGSFTDPGDDAPWTATFAWNGVNDPGQTKTFTSSDAKTFSVRPNFGTAGCQLTGKVTVTEQEGAFGTDTKTVNVGSGEFLPPMTNQPVTDKLKNGQVLPVKVRIADCNGNPISGLSPKIELKPGDLTAEVADNSVAPIDITNASAADTSGFMRAVDGSYMYNLRINVPSNMLNQPYTIVITPNASGYPSGMTLRHKIVATK